MPLKRKLLIAACIALPILVVTPVALLSSTMMDAYQRRIDRNPHTAFNRWLQMASADCCASTWRPEMAATGYRRYYERYPGDMLRAHALLRYAQSLEEAGRTADAKDIYKKFLIEYPDLEGAKDARIGLNRIDTSRR